MTLETRVMECEGLRVVESEGQPTRITGYAAVFNSLSKTLRTPSGRKFREQIAPGAFKRSLDRGADVRALVEHNKGLKLGRRKSGTLEIREDNHGLYVEITPPNTTAGRDALEEVRRGDLSGMSFGFSVPSGGDSFERREDAVVRTLRDVDLFEVTLTGFPAYEDTEVSLRSVDEFVDDEAEEEKQRRQRDSVLREAELASRE